MLNKMPLCGWEHVDVSERALYWIDGQQRAVWAGQLLRAAYRLVSFPPLVQSDRLAQSGRHTELPT
jgi:hypothetical protein